MIIASILISLAMGGTAKVSCQPEPIRIALVERMHKDQSGRQEISASSTPSKELLAKVVAIDLQNRKWLRSIIEACGWPKRSNIGDEAAKAAWLIAQHSDMDLEFQAKAAELMKIAVLADEASGEQLAFLVDRNRRSRELPQMYGTQAQVNPKGVWVFMPIEQPENLNKRRAEIGLPPISAYMEELRQEDPKPVQWPAGVPKDP